jgi:uncharacterized integral membrane protein
MKFQWNLLFGLLFAIVIAWFAIVNVESVKVNYIFGEAQWPLILVILGSAFLGAIISIFVAMFRSVQSKHRMKELQKEMTAKELTIAAQQNEIAELQKQHARRVEHVPTAEKLAE